MLLYIILFLSSNALLAYLLFFFNNKYYDIRDKSIMYVLTIMLLLIYIFCYTYVLPSFFMYNFFELILILFNLTVFNLILLFTLICVCVGVNIKDMFYYIFISGCMYILCKFVPVYILNYSGCFHLTWLVSVYFALPLFIIKQILLNSKNYLNVWNIVIIIFLQIALAFILHNYLNSYLLFFYSLCVQYIYGLYILMNSLSPFYISNNIIQYIVSLNLKLPNFTYTYMETSANSVSGSYRQSSAESEVFAVPNSTDSAFCPKFTNSSNKIIDEKIEEVVDKSNTIDEANRKMEFVHDFNDMVYIHYVDQLRTDYLYANFEVESSDMLEKEKENKINRNYDGWLKEKKLYETRFNAVTSYINERSKLSIKNKFVSNELTEINALESQKRKRSVSLELDNSNKKPKQE